MDFDPGDIGTLSDLNSCYFEEPALDAFFAPAETSSERVYEQKTLSKADLQISHRSDGFTEQRTVVMCCTDAKGAVTAIDARQMFISGVEEYAASFVQVNAGALCKGAIELTSKVEKYVSFKHLDGFYVDFAHFNKVDRVWKSACSGLVIQRTPIDTDTVKMNMMEVSDFGALVGVSSI